MSLSICHVDFTRNGPCAKAKLEKQTKNTKTKTKQANKQTNNNQILSERAVPVETGKYSNQQKWYSVINLYFWFPAIN